MKKKSSNKIRKLRCVTIQDLMALLPLIVIVHTMYAPVDGKQEVVVWLLL